MSSKALIEDKISSIQKYLAIVAHYQQYTQAELVKDVTLRGATERYLYLLAQSAIDLAEMIIAYKKLRKPATMSESFEILEEAGLVGPELREKMIKLVGFRNIIAHDYATVDYDIVYDVLQNKLADVTALIDVAEKL